MKKNQILFSFFLFFFISISINIFYSGYDEFISKDGISPPYFSTIENTNLNIDFGIDSPKISAEKNISELSYGHYEYGDYIESNSINEFIPADQQKNYVLLGQTGTSVSSPAKDCIFSFNQELQTPVNYVDFLFGPNSLSFNNILSVNVKSHQYDPEWINAKITGLGHDANLTWSGIIYEISTNNPYSLQISMPTFPFSMKTSAENYSYFYGFYKNGTWNLYSDNNQTDSSIEIGNFNIALNSIIEEQDQFKITLTVFFEKRMDNIIPDSSDSNTPIRLLLIFGIIATVGGVAIKAMTSDQYVHFVRRWVSPIKNKYRLTYDEIFENENRMAIINSILLNPGIHFSKLREICNLHPGQLRWHLDVLLSYGVIKSKQAGQYVLYFPVHKVNPLNVKDLNLLKSEKTLQILAIIRYSPGINANTIAQRVNMQRHSVKYHIDKLLEQGLIIFKMEGKQKMLFYNTENDFPDELQNIIDNSEFEAQFQKDHDSENNIPDL